MNLRKHFLSNVEEINLLLSFFKKLRNKYFAVLFPKKIAMQVGHDEQIINCQWPNDNSQKYLHLSMNTYI